LATRTLQKIAYVTLMGTGSALLSLLLWATGALDRLEFVTWAWRVNYFAAPGPATSKIKLILLDQNSLDWGARENGLSWPWPREVYGPVFDFCARSGAKAIIFDVICSEPSVYGASDDAALGDAIRRAPALVGTLFCGKDTGSAAAWPKDVRRQRLVIDHLNEWLTDLRRESVVMPYASFPIPEVANSASLLANVMDGPDVDGVFRRVSPFRVFDGQPVLSLGIAPYAAVDASAHGPAFARIDDHLLQIGSVTVPIDRSGKAILRFRGPSGTHATYSAASVIQSELRLRAGEAPTIEDVHVFKDCYVFFGLSAPGLYDLRPTPVGNVYPGVEIYATMLDNLLSRDFMVDASKMLVVSATLFLAWTSAFAVVLFSRKAWHSLLIIGIFLPVPAAAGMAAYALGVWWPVVVDESSVVAALVGGLVFNYATEGRQKTFLKHAFKHYLSPAVIERILDDPSKLKLGGERRELTILFSDLQGFSSISERLDPEALTCLLNDYLSDMTDIILEEGGTLDKYEGDAIIAFWNAPLEQSDHAVRACRAALRCQHKLEERREEFRQRTGETLRARIGIHTGTVVVGNMGSRSRFDYTVLGDAANLASRLEGANKPFGTYLMVSEVTWAQVNGRLSGREIGQLRVVGRKTPVRVYEPLGFEGEAKTAAVESFHRGLAYCYRKQWLEALAIFESLPDDPLASVYAHRCKALSCDPSSSWDGVWNLTEK
jgi:adenylate cyclase